MDFCFANLWPTICNNKPILVHPKEEGSCKGADIYPPPPKKKRKRLSFWKQSSFQISDFKKSSIDTRTNLFLSRKKK